jgi:chromosome segregation ATPase
MIDKLYKLKKTQTDQKLMQKGQIMAKIHHLEDEVMFTKEKINTTSVQKHGAISDFAVLAIHRNTMKLHIVKLEIEKNRLNTQLESIIEEIIELQKETEQYGYMLEEQKQEEVKRLLLAEEEASSEYMQSKYING